MWDTRGYFLDKKNQDIGIPPVSGLEDFDFKKNQSIYNLQKKQGGKKLLGKVFLWSDINIFRML